MKIEGYIENLGKYNEGKSVGKWVEFPLYENELKEVLEEIGISNEPDENGIYYDEYFFPCWRCFHFGDFPDIDDINNLAEEIEDTDEQLVDAILEFGNINHIVKNGLNADNYILLEGISCDYELGYYHIEKSGTYSEADLEKLGKFRDHLNYESIGRYLRTSSKGTYTSHGWLEYIG